MKYIHATLCALLFVNSVQAAEPSDRLSEKLNAYQSISAKFEQVVKDVDGHVMQKTQGTMKVLKPWHFFWGIEKPYVQQIIIDGKNIWNYEPDLEQVSVKSLEAHVHGTPAYLLAGELAQELDKYEIKLKTLKSKQEMYTLSQSDDVDNQFQTIFLYFSKDKLVKMRLSDQIGNETIISFDDMVLNEKMDKSLFQFKPPKGIDVIGEPIALS